MSQDFLSQEEVDALLRGVTSEPSIRNNFDILDSWVIDKQQHFHIHLNNDKVRNYMEKSFIEGKDFSATSARPKTNYVVTESLLVMLKLKFSENM